MHRKPIKVHIHCKVFLLTSIIFLLTFYIPIYLYSLESYKEPVKHNKKVDEKPVRERKANGNTRKKLDEATVRRQKESTSRTIRRIMPRTTENNLEAMVPGWELNVSRDTSLYVFPHNITTIINLKNVASDLFLSVMVFSAPGNFLQRSAVRDTWASLTDNSTRVSFLLGQTDNSTLQDMILEESEVYDDIIQERFVDSYNNLSIKSVMMLKWMQHYKTSRFVMKADDDTYINLPAVSEALVRMEEKMDLLVGFLICKAKPIHSSTNKWYTPRYIYNKRYFPFYLSGTGYVMSHDVVPKLYRAALSTPIVHLEDIYITGICAQAAGVPPLFLQGFHSVRLNITDFCDPSMFTNHHLRPEDLRTVFSYFNKCSTPSLNQHSKLLPPFVPRYCTK